MATSTIDLTRLRTVPLSSRRHLVRRADFGDPGRAPDLSGFVASLPDIHAGRALKRLLVALRRARESGRSIIWGLGGHVIKCGVTPYLVRLMESGFITHLALNGSGIVHDFEIALAGETSEDVAEAIRDGSFGMADETSRILGALVTEAGASAQGLGRSIGRALEGERFPHREASLLAHAARRGVGISVHVALGTDVLHLHPACDWAACARAARIDLDLFLSAVRGLHDGGVYLNLGSAVLLPEVFIKAVSAVRNLGHPLAGFTCFVLDLVDHYRPRENVLVRPGGEAIRIHGHHEIIVPLVAAALIGGRP